MGYSAGQYNQGRDSIAVGLNAGQNNQGINSIAIGSYAGYSNQPNNSIVINSSGISLNGTTANACYVSPIRNITQTNVIGYDTVNKEITYFTYNNSNVSNVFSQSGNDIYYTNGNVGLGTSSPSSTLDVVGNVEIEGNIKSMIPQNITSQNFSNIQFQGTGSTGTTTFEGITYLSINSYGTGTSQITSSALKVPVDNLNGTLKFYYKYVGFSQKDEIYDTGILADVRLKKGSTIIETKNIINTIAQHPYPVPSEPYNWVSSSITFNNNISNYNLETLSLELFVSQIHPLQALYLKDMYVVYDYNVYVINTTYNSKLVEVNNLVPISSVNMHTGSVFNMNTGSVFNMNNSICNLSTGSVFNVLPGSVFNLHTGSSFVSSANILTNSVLNSKGEFIINNAHETHMNNNVSSTNMKMTFKAYTGYDGNNPITKNYGTIQINDGGYGSALSIGVTDYLYSQAKLFINSTPDVDAYYVDLDNNNTEEYHLIVGGGAKKTTPGSGWDSYSDQRIKENIEDANLDTCYQSLKDIKLRRFRLKDEFYPKIRDRNILGFIAQEVETIFPKSVSKRTEKINDILIEDARTINIDQINMVLVGAVQKLIKENEELKQNVSELKDIVLQLKQKVDSF
jgi:hypothetical protein